MSPTSLRGKRRRTEESDTEGSGSGLEVAGKADVIRPRPVSEDVNGQPEPMSDAGESSA
jgi:hypothetical protein